MNCVCSDTGSLPLGRLKDLFFVELHVCFYSFLLAYKMGCRVANLKEKPP